VHEAAGEPGSAACLATGVPFFHGASPRSESGLQGNWEPPGPAETSWRLRGEGWETRRRTGLVAPQSGGGGLCEAGAAAAATDPVAMDVGREILVTRLAWHH
jgi:hypothetical protein